jgi:1,4-alpha-glucan branching enzyme
MQKTTKLHRQAANPNSIELKTVSITFALSNRPADKVCVCGDFNGWQPRSLNMIRLGDNGDWQKDLALPPGRYEYKFIVDDEWIHDPKAVQNVPNVHGTLNSVVKVG